MKKGKVYRGYLYKTDGTVEILTPANGKKFEYPELQKAVGGYIESLIPADKRCKQMYCNEEGVLLGLQPNIHTWKVIDAKVYKLNGYSDLWRVQGNILAVKLEDAA